MTYSALLLACLTSNLVMISEVQHASVNGTPSNVQGDGSAERLPCCQCPPMNVSPNPVSDHTAPCPAGFTHMPLEAKDHVDFLTHPFPYLPPVLPWTLRCRSIAAAHNQALCPINQALSPIKLPRTVTVTRTLTPASAQQSPHLVASPGPDI